MYVMLFNVNCYWFDQLILWVQIIMLYGHIACAYIVDMLTSAVNIGYDLQSVPLFRVVWCMCR